MIRHKFRAIINKFLKVLATLQNNFCGRLFILIEDWVNNSGFQLIKKENGLTLSPNEFNVNTILCYCMFYSYFTVGPGLTYASMQDALHTCKSVLQSIFHKLYVPAVCNAPSVWGISVHYIGFSKQEWGVSEINQCGSWLISRASFFLEGNPFNIASRISISFSTVLWVQHCWAFSTNSCTIYWSRVQLCSHRWTIRF